MRSKYLPNHAFSMELAGLSAWISLFLLMFIATSDSEADEENVIRHSLFIAGPTFTGILNEDGPSSGKPIVLRLATVSCLTAVVS